MIIIIIIIVSSSSSSCGGSGSGRNIWIVNFWLTDWLTDIWRTVKQYIPRRPILGNDNGHRHHHHSFIHSFILFISSCGDYVDIFNIIREIEKKKKIGGKTKCRMQHSLKKRFVISATLQVFKGMNYLALDPRKHLLTLSQTTNFRPFQTERVCRRPF